MKKLFTLAILAVFAFVGCKEGTEPVEPTEEPGLEVENKQRSTLIYYTATWCGPCGSYGSPAFKAVTNAIDNSDLIAFDIHTGNAQLVAFYKNLENDSFYVSSANRLLNNLPLPGSIPAFFLNGGYEGTRVTTGDVQSAVNTYNATNPTVGVAAKAVSSGNNIEIETKAEFFKEAEGTYHLSALVIEKEVNFRQAVGGSYQESFDHKLIVKASARDGKLQSQNLYGDDPIATGTVAVGHTYEGKYTFEYSDNGTPSANFPNWQYQPTNTAIVVIVWKDLANGNKEIVNSVMVDVE